MHSHIPAPQRRENRLDVFAAPRALGEVIQPDSHNHDVANGEEPECRSLECGEPCQINWHPETGDGNDQCQAEGNKGAPVGGDGEYSQEHEEHQEWERRQEGGKPQLPADRIGHGREGGAGEERGIGENGGKRARHGEQRGATWHSFIVPGRELPL